MDTSHPPSGQGLTLQLLHGLERQKADLGPIADELLELLQRRMASGANDATGAEPALRADVNPSPR